jgi:hypothetical protein
MAESAPLCVYFDLLIKLAAGKIQDIRLHGGKALMSRGMLIYFPTEIGESSPTFTSFAN